MKKIVFGPQNDTSSWNSVNGIILLFDCNMLLYIFCKFSCFCISDIAIYLIYIDLMRKRCQLIREANA